MLKNKTKYYISQVLYNLAYLLTTGSVIQAFMTECSISEEYVSFYVALLQMVQVFIMLLVSGRIERIKNIIKATALSHIFQAVLPAALIILCFSKGINAFIAYGAILIFGVTANIAQGINNIIAYKLPYHIMDIKDYGRAVSISGIFISISGAALSFLLSLSSNYGSYFSVMSVFFFIAASSLILSGTITKSYTDEFSAPGKSEDEKINILLYKPFYILALPNLLRGISTGIISVAFVIGSYLNILDANSAGILVLISQMASLLGYFMFKAISKGNRDGEILLFSSIAIAVLFPLLILNNKEIIFYAVYFLLNIVLIIINAGVPVAVTKVVHYDYMGRYSAWRMLLHTLGGAIGSGITVFLLSSFGGTLTLIFAGSCQLISGISYYIFLKNPKNKLM
ncbi:MAG: hypothetical protein IJD97_05265 [Clostridia bacterium]|nr:hypothetical protein [Clostridia bacterium]